jgi:hypothetical protein
MAVASERNGNLESALDWAKRAYFDLNNKRTKSYIDILKFRIRDRERLQDQMQKEIEP